MAARFMTVLAFVALALPAGNDGFISEQQLRKHVEILSSDAFGGRAPGTAGELLTLAYLEEQFRSLGYEPGGDDGSYRQSVPLMGLTVEEPGPLVVSGPDGGERFRLEPGSQFVGWSLRQTRESRVDDADIVFVGYGIVAPEYGWDDYAGIDVTGKVVVALVGDPAPADDSIFGGRAMTYYGRWTYKFEAAAEHGAAGAIVVHNTARAGYPWDVVANSWSGEQFDVVRPDAGASRCALESWITEGAARQLFAAVGMSYDRAVTSAAEPGFSAVPLGLRVSATVLNRTRQLTSNNLVAVLPGRDADRRHETILYTAHWDHLGTGNAVDGDSIYNGALDNASGIAGVLEIARAFAVNDVPSSRSVAFLLTTAEESGLLGAYYYAEHPRFPLEHTVATMNVDGLNVWGPTSDMVVIGYGQSSLDDMLSEVLAGEGREVTPDSEPEKGFYYRSDHFAFAKRGVPALYADSGVRMRGRPEGWGMSRRRAYNRDRYHKPQDEYGEEWDLSGAVEDMRALYLLGKRLADSTEYPEWGQTSEFRRIREQTSGGGG